MVTERIGYECDKCRKLYSEYGEAEQCEDEHIEMEQRRKDRAAARSKMMTE